MHLPFSFVCRNSYSSPGGRTRTRPSSLPSFLLMFRPFVVFRQKKKILPISQRTLQTIPTEHPSSIKALRSSSSASSAATAAPSSSSRTPSPVSFHHQGRGHRGPPPPLQHPFPSSSSSSSCSPSTSTAASTSTLSPERSGKRSWNLPAAAEGVERTNDGSPARGGGGGRVGKWDEEAQESAEGSVGKQILQRYLTNLYPKVGDSVCG